jgi:hypothetical protein
MPATIDDDAKQCWFIPWAELSDLDNRDKPDNGRLRKVDTDIRDSDLFVKEGSPFTISLESFYVPQQQDTRDDNDILVQSFFRYGNEPRLETIHFFEKDTEANAFRENFEHEHIYARQAFSEAARVWLTIRLLEIDRGLNQGGSLTQVLQKMHGGFGAIFPAMLPFAPMIGLASSMISKFRQLKESAQRNEPILENTIDFYDRQLAGGDAPLRCGAYVLFDKPVEGVQYRLGSGFKLRHWVAADVNRPVQHPYVIIKITPGIVESGQDAKQLLTNQQIATVVSELDNEITERERRTEHYKFLENMVTAAGNFNDLSYFKKLMDKKSLGIDLSEGEINKLLEIKQRLGNLISLGE